jgi:hypothetical protein
MTEKHYGNGPDMFKSLVDTLPDKPSELLLVALEDLERAEKAAGVAVDMEVWYDDDGKECSVCFAGGCMVRVLEVLPKELRNNLELAPRDFCDTLRAKFLALNAFRTGDVVGGLWKLLWGNVGSISRFGIECYAKEFGYIMGVPRYRDAPLAFKEGMREIAKKLAQVNL